MSHPDVTRYAFDDPELSVDELAAIDEHLYICADCRDQVLFIRKFNGQLAAEGAEARRLEAEKSEAVSELTRPRIAGDLRAIPKIVNRVAVVRFDGFIYTDDQVSLVRELARELIRSGIRDLVFDLSDVHGIGDNAGFPALGEIRSMIESDHGSLKLKVSEELRRTESQQLKDFNVEVAAANVERRKVK